MEKRLNELENELVKVCEIYEDDCSKCPKQKECAEYIRLSVKKMEAER
jgi:hypothetical protein